MKGPLNYRPDSLFPVGRKIFVLNNSHVDLFENFGFFLISSVVLGLLIQLQIFRELYLIELLELLIGLVLLEL